MPFLRYFAIAFALVAVAAVSIMGYRGQKFQDTPLEVFPDMDRQAKMLEQVPSSFWEDGRADREPIPGTRPFTTEFNEEYPHTAPRDADYQDTYYYTGKNYDSSSDAEWGDGIPVEVNYELIELGQKQYNIYCTVCHGESGDGNGITKQYGINASNLVSQIYADRPDGNIYNTINKGFNTMYGYGTKLLPEERWAVVAYVRALQRAGLATPQDVPADKRQELGL